jgi:hypothetical protein
VELAGETPALPGWAKSCLDKGRRFFLAFFCKKHFAIFEDADKKDTGPVSDPF